MASERSEGNKSSRRDWRRSPTSNADEDERRSTHSARATFNGRNDRNDKRHHDADKSKSRSSYSHSSQSNRDERRWKNGDGENRSGAGSLASRIAPVRKDDDTGYRSRKDHPSDATVSATEDEDVRRRRIQRLKRRRRSAGLDSDISDDELERWSATIEKDAAGTQSKDEGVDAGVVRQRPELLRRRRDSDNESESGRRRYRTSDHDDRRRDDRRDHDRYYDRRREGDLGRQSRSDVNDRRDLERDLRTRDRSREPDDRHRSRRGDGDDDRNSVSSSRASRMRSARSPEAVTLRRRRSRSRTPTMTSSGDKNGHSTPLALLSTRHESVEKANIASIDAVNLPKRAGADEVYERLAQVGEGTYGQVFKARSDKTGILVALKKIRMDAERDGFPITAMREVKLLQGLRHENIVRLHEMMLSKHSIYMVFEYLQHDLNGILAHPNVQFSSAHLKSLAAQLLSGLAYIHKHSILHRDLKCSNLLLDNEGTLKLADFGLARAYTKQDRAPRRRTLDYTNRVVTLWYRAPELLFGETSYDDAIDVWGAGCIFLELFLRKPIFQGNDEVHQVHLLFSLLGPVHADEWPEATGLPWFDLVKPADEDEVIPDTTKDRESAASLHRRKIRKLFDQETVQDDVVEAAFALLTYNPAVRLSAQAAIDTLPYFASNEPRPEKPAKLLQDLQGEWHEFESRKARREAAAQALHAHVHRENENERERKRLKEQSEEDGGKRQTDHTPALDTEMHDDRPTKEQRDEGYVSA